MLKTLLVWVFAFASLSQATRHARRSGRSQLLFGVVTDQYVTLQEITMGELGGVLRLKNHCLSPLWGEIVVATNGVRDREPYIGGTIQDVIIRCTPKGPYAQCTELIIVNVTQFC